MLLRRRIGELELERFTKAADPGKFLRDLLEFFRRCHDELRTPDDYDAYLAQLERDEIPLPRVAKSKDAESMPREEVLGRCHEIARAFRYVEDLLKQEGLGTFGHIITRAVELLGRRQSVLQSAQKRARFILIDEFQDSNVAQITTGQTACRRRSQRLRGRRPRPGHLSFSRRHQRGLRPVSQDLRPGARQARHHVGQPALDAADPELRL